MWARHCFVLFVTTMNSCSQTYKLSWLGKLISSCTQVCGWAICCFLNFARRSSSFIKSRPLLKNSIWSKMNFNNTKFKERYVRELKWSLDQWFIRISCMESLLFEYKRPGLERQYGDNRHVLGQSRVYHSKTSCNQNFSQEVTFGCFFSYYYFIFL